MKIEVNGETRELVAARLDQALHELGYTEQAVATALNGDFVAAANRPRQRLADGDRLEVLAPMQGG